MQKPLSTDKERRFPRAGDAKLAEGLLFKMWRPGYPKSCFQVSNMDSGKKFSPWSKPEHSTVLNIFCRSHWIGIVNSHTRDKQTNTGYVIGKHLTI